MAQKSKQRQPVYSADTLVLRFLAGLVLVALGVMMFLAVEMRMAGNVFAVLRQVCYGLTGGLAAAAPVLVVTRARTTTRTSTFRNPLRMLVTPSTRP